MKLLVGLGNPGREYEATRHNVGYRAVDILRKRYPRAGEHAVSLFKYWLADIGPERLALVKSRTYMNESGRAAAAALTSLHATPADLIVVHDDLDIPLGRIKLSARHGPGGHKGVRSLIQEIGSDEFLRVRIGIGGDTGGLSYIDYVLAEFAPAEEELVARVLDVAADACRDLCLLGWQKAMTKYNDARNGSVLGEDGKP